MTTYNDRLSAIAFLAECSRLSLDDFLLSKQNRISNLEKDLRDLIGRLGENVAFVELANMLREFELSKQGQGATELSTSPQRVLLPPYGWIWILDRTDISHIEQDTLLGIKSFANANHVARCASIQIARRVKLSIQSIERGIQGLRKKRFIETESYGKGLVIRLLEPPPALFSAPSVRGSTTLRERDLVPLVEGVGPSVRGTLYVHRYTGTPAPLGGAVPGRGLPPNTPAALSPQQELRKLELEAEILGRTERLQKKPSGLEGIAQSPVCASPVRKEVLERDRLREEQRRKASRR